MMKSETEILEIIKNVAAKNPRVFAAYLRGSRTNPLVPKDRYRDFDVMYVVHETSWFISDTSWMEPFGKVILKQEQSSPFGYGDRFGISEYREPYYSWLLLLEDGNRIDIGVETVPNMMLGVLRNRLYVPLLDKTGCLPPAGSPGDSDFYVKPPEEAQYRGCVNEFFWTLCDVLKGIARDEMPFALATYNTLTHPMLEKMLEWKVGCDTDFSVSCGKDNKYFKKYLSDEAYIRFMCTYTDGSCRSLDTAIAGSCSLFHETAICVGRHMGYRYPQEDEDGYLKYAGFIRSQDI